MSLLSPFTLCLIVFAASWAGCALMRRLMPRLGVLDMPNARSNHAAPTPRGGGVAVTLVLAAVLALGFMHTLAACMIALMLVGLFDDRRHVPVWLRLLVQLLTLLFSVISIVALLILMRYGSMWFWPVLAASVLFGMWWINTYNFMDGIDGITGLQTITIGLGMVAVWHAGGGLFPELIANLGLLTACAMLGFWLHNRHPAKLFLGDSGSLPLGLMTLWLLVHTAFLGSWAAALILPAYYVVDGGITLKTRILRRERFWEAHSQHAYQRAVRRGLSHDAVVLRLLSLSALLIALAWLATAQAMPGWACVAIAYAAALGIWAHLKGGRDAAAAA